MGYFNFKIGGANSVVIMDSFPNASAFGVADAINFTCQRTAPRITLQPRGTNVFEGGELTLAVMAAGAQPLRYQWQFNRANLPGATNENWVICGIQKSQAGVYRALIISADGSLYTQDAVIRVDSSLQPLSFDYQTRRIHWDGLSILQTATNIAGPFEDMPAATSPILNIPEESQRYYRLKR